MAPHTVTSAISVWTGECGVKHFEQSADWKSIMEMQVNLQNVMLREKIIS